MRRPGPGLLRSARALVVDLSPLRDFPAYRALWVGQIVSLAGTQMRYVAVAWQVFELTRSSAAVGLIGLAEVVPLMVFSVAGGAMADAWDRRKVIAHAQMGQMATSAALFVLAVAGDPPLWALYALTAIASAFGAIDRPARTALLPALVPADRLPAAIALRQIAFQSTSIAGPACAGVIIGAGGVEWAYAIDAVSFAAALAALRRVPESGPQGYAAASMSLASVVQGLRWSFGTPLILSIFAVDLVAMVFGMPRAVFPALAAETFGIGPEGAGLLYAAPAAGALLGALTTGWTRAVRRQGVAVLAAVTVWGAAVTFAGLSLFSLPLTMLLFGIAGAADVVSAIFRNTMLHQATPDALRGRVSALNLSVVIGGPRLGDVEAGLAAALVGAPASIVLGGAACLAGTAVVAWRFPSLRAYSAGDLAPRLPREEPEGEDEAGGAPQRDHADVVPPEAASGLEGVEGGEQALR